MGHLYLLKADRKWQGKHLVDALPALKTRGFLVQAGKTDRNLNNIP